MNKLLYLYNKEKKKDFLKRSPSTWGKRPIATLRQPVCHTCGAALRQ